MLKRCTMIVLVGAVILTVCSCKRGTAEDAQKDLNSVMSIYEGYFSVLDQNKANPEAGIKASQEYVNSKKAELASLAARINRNPKAGDLMDKFQSDLTERSSQKGRELAPVYSGFKSDLEQQMRDMATAAGGN